MTVDEEVTMGAAQHQRQGGRRRQPEAVTVDCDHCAARGPACGDCVVTVLLGMPGTGGLRLEADEREALSALADSGLVPPLRLVPGVGRAVAVPPLWEDYA